MRSCDPALQWDQFVESVPRIRARHPAAPLVLQLPGDITPEAVHLARRAGRLRIRAVVVDGEPIEATLRRILPRPENLADDVIEWLTLRGLRLNGKLAPLIRDIVHLAPRHARICALLKAIHETSDSTRALFARRRLPPPGEWLHAARALHAVLGLQADPELSVSRLAHHFDHADHSALSRQVFRCFGDRPTVLRQWLGWEGLLNRWLQAKRVRFPPPVSGSP